MKITPYHPAKPKDSWIGWAWTYRLANSSSLGRNEHPFTQRASSKDFKTSEVRRGGEGHAKKVKAVRFPRQAYDLRGLEAEADE